jgi:hypothetical protein
MIPTIHKTIAILIAPFTVRGFEWGLTTRLYRSIAIALKDSVDTNIDTPCIIGRRWQSTNPNSHTLLILAIGVSGTEKKHMMMSAIAEINYYKYVTSYTQIQYEDILNRS